jgi:hypothetical protein
VADAVQTFRAISWLIFKWLMISVATVIALTAVGIGIYFAYQWFAYDRHVAKIETMINTAESLCDTTDHPLFVGFVNRSSRNNQQSELCDPSESLKSQHQHRSIRQPL